MTENNISNDVWSQVNDEDKERIQQILKETGTLQVGQIVARPETKAHSEDKEIHTLVRKPKDLIKKIPLKTCNTPAAVAAEACKAQMSGIALIACLAAVEEARKQCQNHW